MLELQDLRWMKRRSAHLHTCSLKKLEPYSLETSFLRKVLYECF